MNDQQQQQKHFHVLVVDDSVIDRKLLERLLRDSSCKGRLLLPLYLVFLDFSFIVFQGLVL